MRELAPSPRDVPTYDHKPEMSAREATEAFLRHWAEQEFAFAIINFANADMVGHTGVIQAAVKAVETVDECLGRVVEAVHAKGGACIVTADHGNADEMLEEDGSPDTAHSLNPVPFIVTAGRRGARRRGDPGRRRADRAGAARDRPARADDGPLAARVHLSGARKSVARTTKTGYPLAHDLAHAPAARSSATIELGAWRGMLRVHAALVRELDAELEAAHALPLTSYDVLIYLRRRPAGGCGWPSWPTACCSAAPA